MVRADIVSCKNIRNVLFQFETVLQTDYINFAQVFLQLVLTFYIFF